MAKPIDVPPEPNPHSKKSEAVIVSFNYRTIATGAVLTIFGENFGEHQGKKNTVLFADSLGNLKVNGHPTFWSDTLIKVPVPEPARSGPVGLLIDNKFSNKIVLMISLEGAMITWF